MACLVSRPRNYLIERASSPRHPPHAAQSPHDPVEPGCVTDDMDDVVREFLGESRENCDQIDLDLVALERSPDDSGVVARIFRAIHTIKGTCGFLGFDRLESVSHAAENVLSALRDEEIAPTPELTTTLLAFVDVARGLLDRIDATGQEGEGHHTALIARLTALVRPGGPPATADPEPAALDGTAPPGEIAVSDVIPAPPSAAYAPPAYAAALDAGYLWHEFGDSHLILRAGSGASA
jgi:two-component system chemotaxis sensor kinase CheA